MVTLRKIRHAQSKTNAQFDESTFGFYFGVAGYSIYSKNVIRSNCDVPGCRMASVNIVDS